MSEQVPPQPLPINIETILRNYSADLYEGIKLQAEGLLYTASEMKQDEYNADAMLAHNEGVLLFLGRITALMGMDNKPGKPEER